MTDAIISGLGLVFQWPAIGFLFFGVLIGIWLGAVPGLGGVIGLVLLLPFTYGMDPISAFALLLGMYAVTSTSDTIASVMLGIPGTAASQATVLDGYPLAKKGHAARAFGAAFSVSAFGGLFGALILAVSLPLALPIIQNFASPEIFMLGVLGLTMVGSLSGGSILKGLTVALLGLLMSTIGYSEAEPIPRYWFGADYLLDGLPLIPVVLGLFAIPELMELALRDVSISRVPKDQAEGGNMMEGVKDAFRHWWLVVRCSIIGTYIGMLPGIGPAIVDWVAYGHAVQSAKDKSQFGLGDIRGVLAPEAANNATKGGALVPTVAFGIPGSLGTAILLGALLIQGLRPGPDMLIDNLDITFSFVWQIVVANIFAAGLLMLWSRQVAKVAFLPGHLIVPGVILFVLMGSWLAGASMGDWIACMAMGAIGYIMKQSGWPRPPLILAFILGGILENAFHISMGAHDGPGWLTRPIVMIIIALVVITVFLSAKGIIKNKQTKEEPAAGEGSERSPAISLPLTITLGVLFVVAGIQSLQWPVTVKQFPLTLSIPAVIFIFIILYYDTREFSKALKEAGNLSALLQEASEKSKLKKAFQFFGYLIGILVIALILGQKIALTLFCGVYLWRWGKFGWRTSIVYAFFGWLFIVVFYDQVMHLFWMPSWLSSWLPPLLPSWIPEWLIV
jgi:TctA family transporter